jgi:hypothetical protein
MKKKIFCKILLLDIKNFKTNKFLTFFSFTVYKVQGAIVGENLTPIGEYSSTFKNGREWVTVYRRVVVER